MPRRGDRCRYPAGIGGVGSVSGQSRAGRTVTADPQHSYASQPVFRDPRGDECAELRRAWDRQRPVPRSRLVRQVVENCKFRFFAMPRTVSDVYEAVTFLGTDTLSSLVLATHVFNRKIWVREEWHSTRRVAG